VKSLVIENVSPLGANAVYTSGARDMDAVSVDFGIAVSNFVVAVNADHDGTLEIDESSDLIVWQPAQTSTDYDAGTGVLTLSLMPAQQYVRAKFTNDATAQTFFTMTTGVDYQ
jgi:hypothetical protein